MSTGAKSTRAITIDTCRRREFRSFSHQIATYERDAVFDISEEEKGYTRDAYSSVI